MNNSNSNTTITAEQLGLPSGPVEIKLGHTFRTENNQHKLSNGSSKDGKSPIVYHTLRYDFKPASVSDEKAQVELTSSGGVTITTPNVEGSASSHSVFRGQRRPHSKECVLVFDRNTGEMVIHRLTDNISVKATRRGVGGGGNVSNRPDGGNTISTSQNKAINTHSTSGASLASSSQHHHQHSSSSSSSHHFAREQQSQPSHHVHAFNKEPQLSESSSSDSGSSSSSSSSPASTRSSASSSPANNEGFYF